MGEIRRRPTKDGFTVPTQIAQRYASSLFAIQKRRLLHKLQENLFAGGNQAARDYRLFTQGGGIGLILE
jgi:hypothetical protein